MKFPVFWTLLVLCFIFSLCCQIILINSMMIFTVTGYPGLLMHAFFELKIMTWFTKVLYMIRLQCDPKLTSMWPHCRLSCMHWYQFLYKDGNSNSGFRCLMFVRCLTVANSGFRCIHAFTLSEFHFSFSVASLYPLNFSMFTPSTSVLLTDFCLLSKYLCFILSLCL